MPARSRTPAEDAATALLQVATDPKKYQKRLDELSDRRIAAEQAGQDLTERAKDLEIRENDLKIGLARVDEMNAAADSRLQEAGKAESDAAARVTAVEAREVEASNREADISTREEVLESERGNALAAVKKLLISDLEGAAL